MIYVHWFTLVIYVVVIIMVMVRVLMDNRQPAKTMAWMLVLTFIPMLGIILYFFSDRPPARSARYGSTAWTS